MENNLELNKLVQKLKDLNVTPISTVDELSTVLIKVNLSDKPDIVTNQDSIIFFDTSTYNSNYLTDVIINYLTIYEKVNFKDFASLMKLNNQNVSQELEIFNDIKNKLKIQTPKTKLYYCDNINVYRHLFEDYIKIDDNNLKPIMLTIKANTYTKPKDIFIDIENFYPFNVKMIMKNILLLHDYNSNSQF